MNGLQGRSTGDDFNQFPGDYGLTGTVESQGEFANHLLGVLTGVVHGGHTGGLLAASALLHRVEDEGGQGELQVALDHFGIKRVVNG